DDGHPLGVELLRDGTQPVAFPRHAVDAADGVGRRLLHLPLPIDQPQPGRAPRRQRLAVLGGPAPLLPPGTADALGFHGTLPPPRSDFMPLSESPRDTPMMATISCMGLDFSSYTPSAGSSCPTRPPAWISASSRDSAGMMSSRLRRSRFSTMR